MTPFLNRPPSQIGISEIDLCYSIHDFMLFLDISAQDKYIFSKFNWDWLRLLYAFLQFQSSKSGTNIDLVNRRRVVYSRAYAYGISLKCSNYLAKCFNLKCNLFLWHNMVKYRYALYYLKSGSNGQRKILI